MSTTTRVRNKKSVPHLSRRERQIMDIVYSLGEASVTHVLNAMPDAPSYSAVRAEMRILEEKGHLTHRWDGPRYVYAPKITKAAAGVRAIQHLAATYFDGSLADLIEAARKLRG